jgi:RsiW-degrading membrane proteinase PrsW (M82 family)
MNPSINPTTIIYAILGGALPAILWLWFWVRQEEKKDREPTGLIVACFIIGSLVVFLAIWAQRFSLNFIFDKTTQIIVWSAIEEILKMLAVLVVISGHSHLDQPIDYPMYFIAGALGFAALENVLFIISPIEISGTVVGMITGNLRFLGATLLHAIASSMIGSAFGLSMGMKKYRPLYVFIGIIFAISLHSLFNFFIIKGSGENFLSVFGFLWVVAIINILIFEKLRRMDDVSNKQITQ